MAKFWRVGEVEYSFCEEGGGLGEGDRGRGVKGGEGEGVRDRGRGRGRCEREGEGKREAYALAIDAVDALLPALGAEVVLAAGALDEGLQGGLVELGVDEGVEFAGHGWLVEGCGSEGTV